MHAYAIIACMNGREIIVAVSSSDSDLVRKHAVEIYLSAARRRGDKTFSVNVGAIHRALGLRNRVPLVCAALASRKFLAENNLRLVARTGPPSGQSTTVDFTYEILDRDHPPSSADAWTALRGIGKEVFASLGGGEAFIREERAQFSAAAHKRESGSKA
jgi:hypothetical protein